MSSNILPAGLYIIYNSVHDQPIGQPPTKPTRKPIVSTSHSDIQYWEIKQIEGDRNTLTINGYVVVSEDNFVWSYKLDPPELPAELVVTYSQGPGRYTITDPKTGGRAWTLKEGYTQVSLEDISYTEGRVDPTQLWIFERIGANDGKSQKDI